MGLWKWPKSGLTSSIFMSTTLSRKLQNLSTYWDFYFNFFVFQRLIFQTWDWPTSRTLLCAFLVVNKKKFTCFGASTHFWKKKICSFFIQTKNSNVCLPLFLLFRDLFFKSEPYQLKELSFAHILVVTRIKLTSHGVSTH